MDDGYTKKSSNETGDTGDTMTADMELLLQAAANDASRQVVHRIAALSKARRQTVLMLTRAGGLLVLESELLEYGRALLAARGAL